MTTTTTTTTTGRKGRFGPLGGRVRVEVNETRQLKFRHM
jgi:hypothetical protein